MTCTRDDSTDCTCPRCAASEDAFWREQGEPDPDMPPDDYEFDVTDLDDVTPLPAAPVWGEAVDSLQEPATTTTNTARRSRAKRRR